MLLIILYIIRFYRSYTQDYKLIIYAYYINILIYYNIIKYNTINNNLLQKNKIINKYIKCS